MDDHRENVIVLHVRILVHCNERLGLGLTFNLRYAGEHKRLDSALGRGQSGIWCQHGWSRQYVYWYVKSFPVIVIPMVETNSFRLIKRTRSK